MPARESETERVRRIYDRRTATGPASRDEANLRWLCGRAQGETLEVGIGRGRTLPFYSRGLHLTGIDLSDVALGVAQARADELGLNAVLRQGDASALPFPDDHFDTVVFAFVLCTIPDDRRAIAEAVRVLRQGGRLLLVEHVRSPNRLARAVERVLDPITVRRQADHLLREPLEHIVAEELEIETLERSWFGVLERLAARKPEADELAEAV